MSSEIPAPVPTDAIVADYCHLRIPSLPEWIEPTVDYLVRRASMCGALHANRTTKVTMALNEAVTNAIVHGNLGISSALKEEGDRAYAEAVAARCGDPEFASRLVDLRSTWDGKALRWVISDQGPGFDVEEALRRLDEPLQDLLRPSGRGLIMIRAFMDEMRYEDRGRRLHLLLRGDHASEHRAATRHSCQSQVTVTPVGAGGEADWAASQAALARNISVGGIALLQTHLATQGRVLITIPGGEGRPPVVVPAEVRHWHALSGNVLEVGCRFDSGESAEPPPPSPSLAEVRSLVERIEVTQKPLSERRVAMRLPYTECVGIELADGKELRGFGRDLSRTGIAFFATEELPLGEVCLVLPQGREAVPIRVRALVVRCTCLSQGFHDVAARFLAS